MDVSISAVVRDLDTTVSGVQSAGGHRIVLSPADQQRVADVLEDDAEVMSNTQLEKLLADEPPAIRAEIVDINTEARPLALQVALLVPLLAAILGLLTAFRMLRIPEPKPTVAAEGVALA